MCYLTFLDYSTLESSGGNVQAKLEEKEREIEKLRQLDAVSRDAIKTLSERLLPLEASLAGNS
jgi:hypothetical protein